MLEERTDEENPPSTTQLINILSVEYGIPAHRTTITKKRCIEKKRTLTNCGQIAKPEHNNYVVNRINQDNERTRMF